HDTEQNRDHRKAFDPAVSLDQQAGGQHLGDDPVLGRGVGGGAYADDGIGQDDQIDLMVGGQPEAAIPEHHEATGDLHRVREEHHSAFGQAVGKGANERGKQDV